jgi:uncharacterized cupin superfamily protein
MSVIIRKPTKEEIEEASLWKAWTKGISVFDMDYKTRERCLILEGEVKVVAEGKKYFFGAGDYVIFRKGLKATWIIKVPVKKKYLFDKE